jgi:hypothetical protein
MNPDNSSLVNKMTLLVLSLILVCLVMLVVRAYQQPLPPEATAPVAEAAAPAEMESVTLEPAPVAFTNPAANRPIRTNVVRAALPPRPAPPLPSRVLQSPAGAPPTLVDPSALVVNSAVTEIAGGGGVQSVTSDPSSGSGPEIVGLVTLVGQPKPEIPIQFGPSCGRLNPNGATTRHFVVGPDGGLGNVFVYLKNARATPVPEDGPLLDQVACLYEPYVLGVVTGQKFTIRNSDPELHNVHATPKLNREFNLGQPLQGQVNLKSFPKPEVFVRMKCDVHPWMFAYIGVVDHPYFTVTDTNGVFRIPPGFPAGTYTVSAMHVKAGELTQKVSIHEGERRALQFQFAVPASAQPQGRVAAAQ